MIISKTPFRMSLVGGWTDIPEYFNSNRGAVITTTFNKYVFVTLRRLPKLFDYNDEIVYPERRERVKSVDEIQFTMVKEAFKMKNLEDLHIIFDSDLPAKSGLGSASSFAVGLLNALECLNEKDPSKKLLASETIHLERDLCHEDCGWQDAITACYGGLNRIDFADNQFKVTPIKISDDRKKELNENLLLFFTGFTQYSSHDVEKSVKNNLESHKKELDEMLVLVDEAQKVLEDSSRHLNDFGGILDKAWNLKKAFGDEISNEKIDELYNRSKQAGALGGKLLGGGGGFLLLYVPVEKQSFVRESLKDLTEIKFKFEEEGSNVIYQEVK